MSSPVSHVAVLGSTGSIGRSTLEVIASSAGTLKAVGLSANSRCAELIQQAQSTQPAWVVAADVEAAERCDWSQLPANVKRHIGIDAIEDLVTGDEVDVVLAAIVGSAGLRGAWAALEAGKTLALANKETLVTAGPLVTKLAAQRGATILPVDSEHSAIFQAMQAGRRSEVRRVILTASGGPFRGHTHAQLQSVTREEALSHPTWEMGPKISIDSATMMNKALEIIEARWLFGLEADQIDVVVHPQSIVHSMVEFADGSVIAQLSPPDMKLPIQYALTWPERRACPAPRLDLTTAMQLTFEPPDFDRFPALAMGLEVARLGGTAGAVLNAANEAAVAGFLDGQLAFTEIAPACQAVLQNHHFDPHPTLEQVLRLDVWARQEIAKWVCA
ncbi:1-deoxy-D-xylulose-5-phosphate reductoisomerase [Lignipirellula cremea]|uniref:1-deoxy-D-xylulose 5-phosphate reductoisomerase n=1 Tax=Lignipirellula cremea TaxID=2528010 RepID=A0A518DR94_9BACT|nr:1-deoxy-D-xylulose-5-phosphate reductoisomerase [Lignipirellula cremea]QDU94357.1 1-deoxy-D-xylulose 5-phosphate reductoisomerase [Lignipirellula cremea]